MQQRTFVPKPTAKKERKWYLVDATDQVLGKMAPKIAVTLRGKNKATFTPHLDMGDYVIVINAEKVRLTGKKEDQKEYIHHTGYLGHIRRKPFKVIQQKNPARIIEEAVAGMIPRNRLKKFIMKKLTVYAGAEHPHRGQNPLPLNV